MKKKLFVICSLLAMILLAGAGSARAQTVGSFAAEIPFDFTIGETDYEVGSYKVFLRRTTKFDLSASVLTFSNEEGEALQTVFVLKNGDRMREDETVLVFDRYGDHYVLARIVSQSFGFTAPKSKTAVDIWLEGDSKPDPETVSIVLKNL